MISPTSSASHPLVRAITGQVSIALPANSTETPANTEKSSSIEKSGTRSRTPAGNGSGLGPGARRSLFASQDDASGLSPQQREVVAELKARDAEVRDHEEAHARVGGQYAGQPSYTYQTGPDGRRYAIGGEVPIDVAPVPGDPGATIAKMQVVKLAALAPAEPSSADRRIAALADAQAREARVELNAIESQRDPVDIASLAYLLALKGIDTSGRLLDRAA